MTDVNNNVFLLGELKQGFKNLTKRLDNIEDKIEKISAFHNQRKTTDKIFIIFLGAISGALANIFTNHFNNN